MGKYVMTDAYIAINGTAFSDHADSLTIADTATKVDMSTFGPSGYMTYGAGLKDAAITVDFFADFDAASIHSTLQPLYASGGTFLLEVRPTSAAVSATNPRGSMICRLYSYSGISGQINNASKFTAEFANAGTAGLTWGTVA